MKVFPAEVVGAGIAECGRTEQRRRSLRARSMAYFAMGMALHSEVRRNTVPLTDRNTGSSRAVMPWCWGSKRTECGRDRLEAELEQDGLGVDRVPSFRDRVLVPGIEEPPR
jgi:hypothetical protein